MGTIKTFKQNKTREIAQDERGFMLVGLIGLSMFISFVSFALLRSVDLKTEKKQVFLEKLSIQNIHQRLEMLLDQQNAIENIFDNTKVDGAPPSAGGGLGGMVAGNSKSVVCLHASGSDCNSAPEMSSQCKAYSTEKEQYYCWVTTQLSDHRLGLLWGTQKNSNYRNLFIDNRKNGNEGGLTQGLNICYDFNSKNAEERARCPYRAELYLWVECANGETKCGPSSGKPGTVHIAAYIRSNQKNVANPFKTFVYRTNVKPL